MRRIGILSDTHGYLDEKVFEHFKECDEIWHAGDFGDRAVADRLASFRPLKGVYGNIDGQDIRNTYPEKICWTCEQVKVYMIHIGGHPAKYAAGVQQAIAASKARLFICGHSHILKVIFDDRLNCLHINPGAAGNQGWHKIRTIIRLTVDGPDLKNCEVIELGPRGLG